MRLVIATAAAAIITLGVSGCGSDSGDPVEAGSLTTSTTTSASTSSTTSTVTSSAPSSSTTEAESAAPATSETPAVAPAPPAAAAPTRPVFMRPEDFDPYGPPRFVQCWERNAAVMSDGSIVTDTVNCAPPLSEPEQAPYTDPPRADGCVGPAATCGYYDEDGNPIWFDKETGETSPRYLDEDGNPTMDPN